MEDIVPGESSTIKLSKQLIKLRFQETTDKLYNPTENQCQQHYPNVAESKITEANHLGFAKSLLQQYSQQLGLNSNHYPAESAFNYYVNNKITDCLGETVNIKSTRKNFYTELFQHTSLPRNHSFTPIIREINQTIERYMQQQFSITYTDKSKGRIQTPAVILKKIQLSSWKKHRVELPTTSSYYYTPGSAINISLVDVSTSNVTSTFRRFQFQSKQQKEDLLGLYGVYFEGFKSRSPMPSRIQLPIPQPDFGATTL
ncbi:hypothetical protein G9A89_017449 [Geosiphon pyriformis]|nr:hypothetical protein G9A89_017449 [Geosiphon pyriformis]